MRREIYLLISFVAIGLLCRSPLWPAIFFVIGAINFKLIQGFYRRGFTRVTFSAVLFIHCIPLLYTKLAPFELAPLPISGSLAFVLLSLSFLFDLRGGKIESFPPFFDYLLYVLYFPRFFFGPFDRFRDFIAQVKGHFSPLLHRLRVGSYLIISGIFKKFIVVAGPAKLTVAYFKGEMPMTGAATLLVLYLCAAELYAVFSGYTDVMRGISFILGIRLPANFRFPFLAKNPLEFWRRWHVSLHIWMRDYVFYKSYFYVKGITISVFLTFVVMGLLIGYRFEGRFIVLGLYCGIVTAAYSYFSPWFRRWEFGFVGSALAQLAVINFFSLGAYFHRIPDLSFLSKAFRSLLDFRVAGIEPLFFSLGLLGFAIWALDFLLWRRDGEEENLRNSEIVIGVILIAVLSAVNIHLYWPVSDKMFWFLMYRKS